MQPLFNGSAPLTPTVSSHNNIQDALLSTSGALSFVGGAAIIVSILVVHGHRLMLLRKLLVYLSLADIICSLSWVYAAQMTMPVGNLPTGCEVQGYSLQFFFLSSFLWTGCLAHHLYLLFVRKIPITKLDTWEKWYHLLSWGVPSVSLLYFGIKSAMGHNSIGLNEREWCWISSADHDTRWAVSGATEQFIFFYLPLVLVLFHTVFVTVRTFRTLPRARRWMKTSVHHVHTAHLQDSETASVVQLIKAHAKLRMRLVFFLFVFMLVVTPGLVNRIYQFFSVDHRPNATLTNLEAAFSPAQGWLNVIVYGVSYSGCIRIWRRIYALICCRTKPVSKYEETNILSHHAEMEIGEVYKPPSLQIDTPCSGTSSPVLGFDWAYGHISATDSAHHRRLLASDTLARSNDWTHVQHNSTHSDSNFAEGYTVDTSQNSFIPAGALASGRQLLSTSPDGGNNSASGTVFDPNHSSNIQLSQSMRSAPHTRLFGAPLGPARHLRRELMVADGSSAATELSMVSLDPVTATNGPGKRSKRKIKSEKSLFASPKVRKWKQNESTMAQFGSPQAARTKFQRARVISDTVAGGYTGTSTDVTPAATNAVDAPLHTDDWLHELMAE